MFLVNERQCCKVGLGRAETMLPIDNSNLMVPFSLSRSIDDGRDLQSKSIFNRVVLHHRQHNPVITGCQAILTRHVWSKVARGCIHIQSLQSPRLLRYQLIRLIIYPSHEVTIHWADCSSRVRQRYGGTVTGP